VNAAFLLVTTAWFAGDTGAPCATCAAPACSTCASHESSGPKLLDRLKALCHKNTCDTCAAPVCAPPPPPPKPVCAPAPKCGCDTCGGGPKLLDRLKALCHKDKCDTCATGGCSTCGTSSCSTCGTAAPAAAPAAAPKAGEPIPAAPKKMPNPVGTEIPGREVRIYTPSQPTIINDNAGQAPQAIAPSFSDNVRNPF
jgi:hypothetical protein